MLFIWTRAADAATFSFTTYSVLYKKTFLSTLSTHESALVKHMDEMMEHITVLNIPKVRLERGRIPFPVFSDLPHFAEWLVIFVERKSILWRSNPWW